MSDRVGGDVLLVGSMPFDDVETVFRAEAEALDGHVSALPDGEVGPRVNWVGMLAELVFTEHPDLEELHAPAGHALTQPEGEQAAEEYQEGEERWTFRVRAGREIRFEDLRYGGFALGSYEVFRRLRNQGVIPQAMRFQVCLPGPASAINAFFEEPEQWATLHRAYLDGLAREVDRILAVVPANDLALQFDNAWEVVDLATGDEQFFPFWPQRSFEEKLEEHTRYLDDLARLAPEETLLGYHWCYGTWGGWPMTAMQDLSLCVRMSNEAVRQVGRRVDYLHMPVVKVPDEQFFAPLDDLEVGDTKVFLGLVHDDGVEPFRRRMALARRHVDRFGVAGVCGYGREDPARLPEILHIHTQCAALLS